MSEHRFLLGSAGFALGALVVLFLACEGHPSIDYGGATSSNGDTSAGASGGTPGGASGSGATGSGSGASGAGASGSASGGSDSAGATGEVVVDGGATGGEGGAGSTGSKMACMDTSYTDAWYRPYVQDPTVMSQVQSALTSLNTLTDQADQMRGTSSQGGYNDIFRSIDSTKAGIKGFQFRDGPRGVNLDAPLGGTPAKYSTAFPAAIARGAAFDMDLEYRIGQAMGDEMLAAGQTMILAPTVNILRHPGWGRAQETYGEDSYLLGRLGTAYTVGAQEYVPACVKHYAGNNIERSRETDNATMDEQTLREVFARHFGMIIRDGGVACVMASYNEINGTHSTQNKHLLTDILRDDFGFKGLVLSDWWAMPGGQTQSPDSERSNTIGAISAGLDMELPWALNFSQIESIVQSGALTQSQIATSAARILEQKFRFKVASMNGPLGLQTPVTTFGSDRSIQGNETAHGNFASHVSIAHRAAVEGAVLLKNDGATLPIKRDGTVKKIAVIGANVSYSSTNLGSNTINFATDVRTGDRGSSRVINDPAKSTGPFAGIQAAAGSSIMVTSGNSATAASDADFIVAVAGLTPLDEGEEYTDANDRLTFALDERESSKTQDALIKSLAALNKPMVVVLEGGSVIDTSQWLSSVKALVMAWYPGQDGGSALGELLFGDKNFSGKLPLTWPKSPMDEPPFTVGTLQMDYLLGYRLFDTKPAGTALFPFGSGLSYTTFKYANVQVPCTTVTENSVINVQVQVSNTGTVAGDETVFAFVSFPTGPGDMPRRSLKELKGFYRVSLDPGVTKQITIPIRASDLKYWDTAGGKWAFQSGTYTVTVAPNAALTADASHPDYTAPLTDTFQVP